MQPCFQTRTRIPGITVHQAMPAIPAHPASAQDTRCKRPLQTRPPGSRAHRASAQDTRCRRRPRNLKPAMTSNEHRSSLRGGTWNGIHPGRHLTTQPRRLPLMGWSGRAPAPPASEAGKGRPDLAPLSFEVRFTPTSGHHEPVRPGPKSADFAAKVENRATLKISPKLIFGLLCCCVVF